jgi:condensin complex subunit 2
MPTKAKRKSSIFGARSNDPQTPVIENPAVDDEAERRGRLRLQKRQSLGHGTPVVAAPNQEQTTSTAVSGYSAAQLAELYSNCMKLSAENKISVKNAFHLQLIDYMAEMMKTKKNSDMDNFQAASCALDASAKIYAYRVDSVHSDTLKLAGGVGKSSEDKEEKTTANNEMDDNGDGGDEDMEKKKMRKKKRSATVEKNLNNIDINKFDLEFDVDPLFKKTSTQFDSGGGGGQFLCNLYIRDEGCQLLLDSDAYLNQTSEALSEDDCMPLVEENTKIVPKIEENIQICPPFNSFSFKNWTLENEDPAFLNLSLHNDKDDETKADDDKDEGQHAFDANAPPIEDLNDDSHGGGGGFMDDNDFDMLQDQDQPQTHQQQAPRGIGMELMSGMKQRLTTVPNEYSYFDDGRLGAWAGPRHWKFKPSSKPTFAIPGQRGGVDALDKKKKQPKEALGPHNVDTFYLQDEPLWISVEKTVTVPKKPIKLQNKTMVNWSEERFLLPTDLHYKGKDFAKVFTAPDLHVTNKGAVVPESVDDSINEYDFGNANDADDFCPSTLPENSEVGNYEDGGFPSQTILPTQSQAAILGLVDAPNRVEKIAIGYAKQAKKMDMRKLKAVEWNILEQSCIEQDKENDETKVNEGERRSLTNGIDNLSTNFGQLYKNLSESRFMSSKMVENLSVPLAFVALLHLCNEKTLSLESMPDFSDFNIAQG